MYETVLGFYNALHALHAYEYKIYKLNRYHIHYGNTWSTGSRAEIIKCSDYIRYRKIYK